MNVGHAQDRVTGRADPLVGEGERIVPRGDRDAFAIGEFVIQVSPEIEVVGLHRQSGAHREIPPFSLPSLSHGIKTKEKGARIKAPLLSFKAKRALSLCIPI